MKKGLSYNFYIFLKFYRIEDDDCSLSVSEDSGFYFEYYLIETLSDY
jgi:hypothetical protein